MADNVPSANGMTEVQPGVFLGHGVLHSPGWHWAVDSEYGRATGYAVTTWGAYRQVHRVLRRNAKMRRWLGRV